MSLNIERTDRKRVVIVGGGFGGLKLANELHNSGFQVILIDRNNYHQFPPLIYQVAASGLEPSSIAFPFRKLFKRNKDIYFRLAEARVIWPEKKLLQTSIGKVEYDYLVLAAGATSNFFGNQAVEREAIPMKTLSEAMGLRNALLGNFERSITCATAEERRELRTIVIVGGGATGVEIAGALAEMKRYIFPKDYPEMDMNEVRVILIEAGSRLLAAMSPVSSEKARKFLEQMGVEVRVNTRVLDYKDYRVCLESGESIPSRTFIWVSGIQANIVENMPADCLGRGRRIKVDAFNRVEGIDDVFCIGDQALMTADARYPNGHPQLAQVAIQQGRLLARNLKRLAKGEPMQPFAYRNLGTMATVGRNKAVVELGAMKFQGWFAWVLWLVVHLRSILGVRNKMNVLLNWMWNYFTYEHSLRSIIYAKKAKVVIDREQREATVHLK